MNASSPSAVVAAVVGALLCVVQWGCGPIRTGGMPGQDAPGSFEYVREAWSFASAEGVKLTSDHYILYTTCASKPFVDALPGFLETCWHAYSDLLPCDGAPERRLEAYLFKTRPQWEFFTERFSPDRADIYKRIRSGGYSERGITVSHYSTRRGTLSILAHEGLHQFLEATRGRNIPAWLNEGIACYFEAFDLDLRTGRPIFKPETNYMRTRSLRDALAHGGLIPLRDLLATHAGVEIQKHSRHVRSYYAQEWSLVLFLMRPSGDNPYRGGFLSLLRDLGTDTMDRRARGFLAADTDGEMSYGEAVFRAYVTDEPDRFEEEYKTYLYKLLRLET